MQQLIFSYLLQVVEQGINHIYIYEQIFTRKADIYFVSSPDIIINTAYHLIYNYQILLLICMCLCEYFEYYVDTLIRFW